MRLFRKFRSLPPTRRVLLFEAMLLTGVARLALLLPFRWVAPFLGRHMLETGAVTGQPYGIIGDVEWAIAAVSGRVPWQSKCLVQAIAARVMLGRRGYDGTLYLGVAKNDGNLRAHAWLRSGSTIVTGGRGIENFTVVSRFAFNCGSALSMACRTKPERIRRRRWSEQFAKLFQADYCPIVLRWRFWQGPTTFDQIRHAASRHYYADRPPLFQWLAKIAMLTTWPLRALSQTVRFTRRFGRETAQRTGKSRLRQCVEQIKLAASRFLPSSVYYRYEYFSDPPHVDFLHQADANRLFDLLNRKLHTAIEDKNEFASVCERNNLPTVPVIGVCESGRVKAPDEWPDSFFLKPAIGNKSAGAMVWRVRDNFYQRHDGLRLKHDQFLSFLSTLCKHSTYIVQPHLENHPDIADISSGALATARIVTGRLPSGTIVSIVATFRMPVGTNITVERGICSPVNLDTGALGRADSCKPLCPGFDCHPDTKSGITGRTLPDWHEANECCQRAHRLFPGYAFLGWDVALTPSGAMLLEGNAGWDVILVQKPHHQSLMQTKFATICQAWLDELKIIA